MIKMFFMFLIVIFIIIIIYINKILSITVYTSIWSMLSSRKYEFSSIIFILFSCFDRRKLDFDTDSWQVTQLHVSFELTDIVTFVLSFRKQIGTAINSRKPGGFILRQPYYVTNDSIAMNDIFLWAQKIYAWRNMKHS